MEPSDSLDIEGSLHGDGEAYARLVRRYQDQIAAQMWRFSHNPVELEELVQDVFVEAYIALKGFRGEAPLLHWLRRIATRVGYRYWKRRRRQERHLALDDWDALTADPGPAQQEAADMLQSLLGRLSPADRLVLTLVHLEGLTVAQAAERTGWSRIVVKVRAHRARKRLKALLEKWESEGENRSRHGG
jgi:RNA polymerase sigma-70 factor (ECF subfamily)